MNVLVEPLPLEGVAGQDLDHLKVFERRHDALEVLRFVHYRYDICVTVRRLALLLRRVTGTPLHDLHAPHTFACPHWEPRFLFRTDGPVKIALP